MNKNDNLNILVSGGAGFVGSNIVNAYIENGHRVWVADNLSSGFIENLNPKADFFNIDIRDEKLENIFKKVNFNIVNHHAAQTNIRKSLENPIFDSQVNVIGTLNILESCKKYNIKKIIFASSGGAIYGESEFPKKEIDKKKPISPYGIAKYANELYIEFYTSTYNISYSILRYSNIYGYRQNVNGEIDVISNFINKILNNEKVNIYGDGNQIRDYIFIEDVVKANLNTLD
ncbi:MAG: NAD-dependent epimerase/dehydratase family protein, partial [Elusimicrobiota bacterium]|nr:NAD-dependent epimerase/dehydratase family protein [Elusimicrobiota bacterium]